jgi:hypothetical protein
MARKPPPPSSETVSENGFWRSAKLNVTVTGRASNGSAKPAPSVRFERAKTPTCSDGSMRP